MSSLGQRKGKAYERWVAIKLRKHFPRARRGLSQTRSGDEVSDVDGTPFWVECKHHYRVNARAALKQAQKDSESSGKLPVVISRDNNKPDIVTMGLDEFLYMASLAFEPTDKET